MFCVSREPRMTAIRDVHEETTLTTERSLGILPREMTVMAVAYPMHVSSVHE